MTMTLTFLLKPVVGAAVSLVFFFFVEFRSFFLFGLRCVLMAGEDTRGQTENLDTTRGQSFPLVTGSQKPLESGHANRE